MSSTKKPKKGPPPSSERIGRARRVPDVKPGRYADGMPYNEVQYLECKLILRPNHFMSRQSFFDFAKVIRRPANEAEVGFSYAEVDRILFRLVDRRLSIDEVIAEGFDRATVERVDRMVAGAEFKRQVPPIAKIGPRTAGIDYLYPRRRPRSSRG